ncbi:MAG TPA: redoxin domain-containing protein [Planctomycetes bacterium]|nr:redoxin domain-containing protein [Planctomycetota bacterium]HIL36475.1 redoxin domain-containing protein [Planctomycetota bacterium]
MISFPLILVPLFAGIAPQEDQVTPSQVLMESIVEDAFSDLEAEFDEAYDGWRAELRKAKGIKAKRALREKHPVRLFWDRFQGLADGGEGRALIWMTSSLRNKGLRLSAIAPEKVRIAKLLLKDYSMASWFGDGVDSFVRDRKHLGQEWVMDALRRVAKVNKDHNIQALCKYELVGLLRKLEGKQALEEADALMAELLDHYADTEYGFRMRAERTRPEDLKPGKEAPEFLGRTIDGHDFKLSDYRGKVVLIDFYGFW